MTSSTEERRLFYERFARDFDAQMHPAEVSRRLEFVFGQALPPSLDGRSFLDAGCGTGLFSAAACERGARVTSLDVGPNLLAEVARKCDSERVVGDVMALPFEDNAFDVVLSTEVVEHTEEPARALAELVRVARPGGTIVITTPNRRWRFAVAVAGALGLRPYEGLENWLSFAEFTNAIASAGVAELRVGGFNAIPASAALAQRAARAVDRLGMGRAGRFMVNMYAIARR